MIRKLGKAALAAALLAAPATGALTAPPPPPDLESTRATVEAWIAAGEGGVVILYAVPETLWPMDPDALSPEEMQDCALQPTLTLEGQDRARAFGAFAAHAEADIDFSLVAMTCAARQTAALIAKRDIVEWHALNPAWTIPEGQSALLGLVEQQLANTNISPDKARLIVAHEEMAERLAGRPMVPGEAVALRVTGLSRPFTPVVIGPLFYQGGPVGP